ncbi:magnesium transporter CorA family protein [Granulicatella sp. zg-84]|uniref:magnesium transporter CorA family protein n=1 Tax=unclassified Granulicatella TaxID=2630493 RepID=UPI0013D12F97|nr:magnesium transporter CorA family protein [Carnobacteriaceae bacterium zg-ZUI78]QMI86124.1 magnesium transporter CorA family protein [Carnobacteriaceae bacterium zg-84]
MITRTLLETKAETVEWINIKSLSIEDKQILNEQDDLSNEFLEYATDIDESARVEEDDENHARLLSFDVPFFDSDSKSYTTRPLIFIMKDNKVYTFMNEDKDYSQINHLLKRSFELVEYDSLYHMIFSVVYNFSLLYHEKLRILHKEWDNIEKSFRKNASNSEIYRLLNVEKGLVYLSTSLKANKIALNTLRRRWGYGPVQFSDRESEKLEDVLVEIMQAIEVSEINIILVEKEKQSYSTIIDNNMNTTMKALTIWTVLLTVPEIVFGFYGMNTKTLPLADSSLSWLITILISIGFCFVLWHVFKKMKMLK